jgi:hypothetical protein
MVRVLSVPEAKAWSWGDFVRGPWNLIAIPLALIILVDLSARLMEWPASIQSIAEEYSTLRAWAFSWSPISIPLEWDNYIVLLCLFFSVTSVSYRRKTGKSFIADVLSFGLSRPFYDADPQRPKSLNKCWQEKLDDLAAIVTGCAMIVVIGLLPALCFLTFMSVFVYSKRLRLWPMPNGYLSSPQ